MTRIKLVRLEDGHAREWWQIAIRGPWYWPLWGYVNRIVISDDGIRTEPAEWVTLDEAMEAYRAIRSRLRATVTKVVEEKVMP